MLVVDMVLGGDSGGDDSVWRTPAGRGHHLAQRLEVAGQAAAAARTRSDKPGRGLAGSRVERWPFATDEGRFRLMDVGFSRVRSEELIECNKS